MLEVYSLALLRWWRERLTWRDSPAAVIWATPQRAFAEMERILVQGQGTKDAAERRGQQIPLPFISLSEAGLEEYDGSRDSYASIRGMFRKEGGRTALNVDWPTPENLPYQLDFWCETINQRRQFVRQIRKLFKLQIAYVLVDFTDPSLYGGVNEIDPESFLLGQRKVALNLSSWTDASNLEPGQTEKREIRFTLGMNMRAWMARSHEEVPVAQEIVTSFETFNNEVFDLITVSAE